MRKIIVPPIKCQGIKSKLAGWILEFVKLQKGECWIEPFMGSGVVGFNLQPERALFCDLNPHLINFYNSIKEGKITSKIAREFLEKEGSSLKAQGESYYYFIRERFNETRDSLDFLFLNRACFNGVIRFNRKGFYNVPFGHKPERFAKAYVTKICNQIEKVEIATRNFDWRFVCQDFRRTISESDKNDLIYCDPPYFGRHADYFNSWTETEESELFGLLEKTAAKFILSTWHSNEYRDNQELEKYSKKFEVVTRQHFYHVGASEKNRKPMTEAIVLNYTTKQKQVLYQTAQAQLFA
ncbi:MAG: Dam family site-specific DNA-(adenine-N6)-methyltransferase [Pyrinomonadaceae bacterium]|nr:Dam family site-specific DNA-(adenine-N6)-methyltransferase [Pyrinomonadaceae bacterium]